MSKPITVEKLQSFIEAVIFAADLSDSEEWVPTARQWKKIYEMIESLEATNVSPQPTVQQQPVRYATASPTPAYTPMPMRQPMGLPPDVPMAGVHGGAVRASDIDTSDGNYTTPFA